MSSRASVVVPDLALGVLVGAVMAFSVVPRRFPGKHHGGDFVWGALGHGATGIVVAAIGIALVVAAIATRRVWPVPAWLAALLGIVAFLVVGGPIFPGSVLAAAVVFFVLLRRVDHRTAAWLGALMLPAFWTKGFSDPGGFAELESLLPVIAATSLAALPGVIGLVITGRRASLRRDREEELRKVAYEERIRIARDIHDVVGHSLSLIALQSGVALRVLDDNPVQARASLEAIRGAARTSMDELRHTLAVFRTQEQGPLAPTPGLAEIGMLVDAVRSSGREVSLQVDVPVHVPEAIQLVAHRVVQEGLTNAVKHAPEAAIEVDLRIQDNLLLVTVRDQGEPPPTITEGLGLRGMRERVNAIGGNVSVRPGLRGVEVVARLPLGART